MIRGVGVDAVSVARMRRALERTPRVEERVFTDAERAAAHARPSPAASFAARFAAKEACRKALGAVIRWRDIEIASEPGRPPRLRVAGADDVRLHVSLTHTADVAVAVVVAEA